MILEIVQNRGALSHSHQLNDVKSSRKTEDKFIKVR